MAIDLTSSLKTKIDKIEDIEKEDTSETDYIYPVEVDGTNAVANVLPIQAMTTDLINVSLALPLTAGRGRPVQIDLSESIKTNRQDQRYHIGNHERSSQQYITNYTNH